MPAHELRKHAPMLHIGYAGQHATTWPEVVHRLGEHFVGGVEVFQHITADEVIEGFHGHGAPDFFVLRPMRDVVEVAGEAAVERIVRLCQLVGHEFHAHVIHRMRLLVAHRAGQAASTATEFDDAPGGGFDHLQQGGVDVVVVVARLLFHELAPFNCRLFAGRAREGPHRPASTC